MSRSIKAQKACLDRLRLAIKRNGFRTQRDLAETAGFSLATVKKFLAGKPVDFATFSELCNSLNLEWQTIADLEGRDEAALGGQLPAKASPEVLKPEVLKPEVPKPEVPQFERPPDWGGAMDVSVFYGRVKELETLKQWIIADRCRLVALSGIGGIGKTTLSVKLAHLIQHEFDYLVWRSLRNAPPIKDTLTDLLHVFLAHPDSHALTAESPDTLDSQLRCLIGYLRTHRCLIILDNAEPLFQACDRAGIYRPGYEAYGQLFKTLGETAHNSCLFLTSRELPKEITLQAGETLPVRCCQLSGLPEADGRDLLQTTGSLSCAQTDCDTLIKTYSGNPLALKIIAAAVRDYFDGSIADFLTLGQQDALIFGDVRQLLINQIQRLTALERDIMYWLAINREPVAWKMLQADLANTVPLKEILQAINSLERRSLLEKNNAYVTQQAVIMNYFVGELIDQVCQEIQTQGNQTQGNQTLKNSLLCRYALVKATAKDYIYNAQTRLILEPIVGRLRAEWPSIDALTTALNGFLSLARGRPAKETGYLGGNVLTLLRHLEVNLQGYDFSHMTVWQAYLQGLNLHNVNFTGSDLSNSVFSQPFGSIRTLAFSPSGDVLATGATNCEIWLWQTNLSSERSSRDIESHLLTFRGHQNWVCSVAFSPDGHFLASGSADRTIKLWRVSTGECLQTWTGHTNWVMSVAFSPDGQWLASGSADRNVKLWQVKTGECVQTMAGHGHGVWSVAFSPQGDCLASGSADRTIKIWDIDWDQIDAWCRQTFSGHQHGVWSVAFSPDDGQVLASGSADQTIKLWDSQTGQCQETLTGHTNWVWMVVFSPDGRFLASGSADHSVRVWEMKTRQCLRVLPGHSNWVWSVAFSPDGQFLASGSEDRTMRLWHIHSGQCLKALQGSSNWVWSVAFDPQGHKLASAQGDRFIHLWDVPSENSLGGAGRGDAGKGSEESIGTLSDGKTAIWSVAFSLDGALLASGHEDGNIHLWRMADRRVYNVLSGHTKNVWSVAFSPDGALLASGSADQSIKLWDVHAGQCRQTFVDHRHWVSSVAFHPQGDRLVSGSYDRTLKLWDIDTGQCLDTWSGHTSGLWCIAFSPQGDYLASGSIDQTVRLWEVSSGQCQQVLKGHQNWVMSVAMSPDGHCVASGSADHTIKIWKVDSGDCVRTLEGHRNSVWSVAFSPDGQYLASGSDDKTIKLWSMETGLCVKTFKAKEPYDGMNISGIVGLTGSEIATLQELGAVQETVELAVKQTAGTVVRE